MEITNIRDGVKVVERFKIDLIVWKYNSKIDINDIKRRFKIDLIVWKLKKSVI